LAQRQQVDLAALRGQPPHGGEDRSMCVAKKVLGVDGADHAIERMVVDQDRSEDGALRIGRLRQRPIESDVELRYGHWMKCAQSRGRLSRLADARNCFTNAPHDFRRGWPGELRKSKDSS